VTGKSTPTVRYARTLLATDDRYRVHSVERALELLAPLADAGAEGMTLSDLGRSLGVSKSSAYAILQTLLAHGFVADSGEGMGRRYRLGMALARLGEAVTSQIALRDLAVPVMRSLTSETGLTSRIAVFDEPHAVVIASIDAANSAIQFASNLFKRELMHSSAVGKSMLATLPEEHVRSLLLQAGMPRKTSRTITDADEMLVELDRITRQGYALDDEEDVDGVFCVASVVLDHTRSCAGAISVTGLRLDLPDSRLHELGVATREHARRVSGLLGAPAEAIAR
jgi:IclR family transcriptional regulator, acetate operon repressor